MHLKFEDNTIVAFTDGSSRGNPGPGGWGAVMVHKQQVRELGGRENSTTNNRMELTAILRVLQSIDTKYQVTIYTDSSYALNGITKWMQGWKMNDWKTKDKEPVKNQDIWEEIDKALNNAMVEWKHVKGHVGVPGNERADEIATLFADEKPIKLYDGPLHTYGVNITEITINEADAEKKARSKMKAYSYLSLVDGKVERHNTWDQCKERVDGKSNVKFRKAVSPEDEQAILDEWGVSLGN